MSTGHDPLEDSLRVFRAATALPSDGAATRARVLESAERRIVVRARWRRVVLVCAVLLGVSTFGTAAWTALGHWRSSRAPDVPPAAPSRPIMKAASHAAPPIEAAPALAPVAAPAPAAPAVRPELETSLYGRAHDAHFVRDTPAAALAAWNRYLQQFPDGAFVPDARYNRALCLVRLGRLDDAARALRPFASGSFHGYRRLEATALLDWIDQQKSSP
jgi:TolA-binding protein